MFFCVCVFADILNSLYLQTMKHNINRVSQLIGVFMDTGRFVQSCFDWQSPPRTVTAFIVSTNQTISSYSNNFSWWSCWVSCSISAESKPTLFNYPINFGTWILYDWSQNNISFTSPDVIVLDFRNNYQLHGVDVMVFQNIMAV